MNIKMNDASNSIMDVVDLTQADTDDDDDNNNEDNCGTKRFNNIHQYNTRSTRARAIKREEGEWYDNDENEVEPSPPSIVVVTPEKYMEGTSSSSNKCESGHRSNNEVEEEEDVDKDGVEEVNGDSDDNASIFGNSDDENEEGKKEEENLGDESSDNKSLFSTSGADDCSRFSGGEVDQAMAEGILPGEVVLPTKRPAKKKVKRRRFNKNDVSKFLTSTFDAPAEERLEPECYYFAQLVNQLGRTMRKRTTTISDGPPQRILDDRLEERFEIICSEVIRRKANGAKEDRMGTKYYKSFYLGISNEDGDESKSLNAFLSSIADFESITYEHGPHKTLSRLKLLFSTSCRLPGHKNKFCFFWLPKKDVKVIEDDGHLGCGFIDPDYLSDLLGNSSVAADKFAIQVRLFGPSSFGIAKGMLVVKEGLEGHKIEIPKSMIKVEKSKAKEPAHQKFVALNIIQLFPSEKSRIMGRLYDNFENDPTPRMIKSLEEPGESILNVLLCKGVSEHLIENYLRNFLQATKIGRDIEQALAAIKHGSLVGVSDPTGLIPKGLVFLTGFGDRAPSRMFLTRSPCTEGKDGVTAKAATWRDMPGEAYQFLNHLPFGAVVFALGDDPLPPKVNSGDLDGDLYHCIWDPSLIEGIQLDAANTNLGKVIYDELVGTEFQHEYNGKTFTSQVVQRLAGDLYHVATGSNMQVLVEMTRGQILEGKDYIVEVADHRAKGSKLGQGIEFKCKWSNGEMEWISMQRLRKDFGDSPPVALRSYVLEKHRLLDGVLPKNFANWLNRKNQESKMEKIIDHRKSGNKIEVLCQYEDGEAIWSEDLEVEKRESKLFVAAYAKKKHLFGQPGWEGIENFWLDEVQHLMCNEKRSGELSTLTPTLYSFWKKSFEEKGPNHDDTIIWGRAYKESNDIEKHGVVLKLPLHLYRKLSETCKNYVEEYDGDAEEEEVSIVSGG